MSIPISNIFIIFRARPEPLRKQKRAPLVKTPFFTNIIPPWADP